MGTPRVELLRDTIRHACGVTHVVSLTKPTSTFHPRPSAMSGFYAIACFFRSILSQGKRLGVIPFPTFNLDDPSKSPLRGETLALQKSSLIASPLSYQERGGSEVCLHHQPR
ncbi:MAG: hypothetical protein WBJ36_00885 [Tenuifilum sp.]|uniref:hypothetical protein n=1 Tax=Tenuifilum sp. TaxID=2760880 RepID=UPI003CABC883